MPVIDEMIIAISSVVTSAASRGEIPKSIR